VPNWYLVVEDIVEEFDLSLAVRPVVRAKAVLDDQGLEEEESRLFAMLTDRPLCLDELVEKTQMEFPAWRKLF